MMLYFSLTLAVCGSVLANAYMGDNITSSSDFQFRIKNTDNNAYMVSCVFVPHETYYDSSHVKSTSQPYNWVNSGSSWDLKYQRIDDGHANGGRCETQSSSAIRGNGKFSASIYIHSNVAPSDGVFTVALVNEDTDKNTEIDLIVVNIQDNVAKSGSPGAAFSFDLPSISLKWIDVILTKINDRCSTTVYSNGQVIFDPQGGTHACNLADGANLFVVNSRARGGPVYASAFISVASAGWEQL